jgi:hypothetical protein
MTPEPRFWQACPALGDKKRGIPTLYEWLKPPLGAVDGLPPAASQQKDHYLYGHPKK